MMSSRAYEKTWFGLSLALLIFFYGIAVGRWQWFPYSVIEQGVGQARNLGLLSIDPHYVHARPFDRSGIQMPRPDAVQPGATLISTNWDDYNWGAGLKLLDAQGETLHRWRIHPATLSRPSVEISSSRTFSAPHGVHLLPNGDVLTVLRGAGSLVRLNSCGDVRWRLPTEVDAWDPHHSISRAEDGTFWVSARRSRAPEHPGLKQYESVSEDLAVHVTPDGEVLDRISMLDVLWENDLQRYVAKQFENDLDPKDLTHLNDVEALPAALADEYPLFEAGDLVVSLRRPDLVLVLDPDTRDAKWHAAAPFINQHDPDFIGDGWIGVFNNRRDFTAHGEMLGGSEIVAVQPHTDSVEVRFPTDHSQPFYTSTAGEWQLLDNGNMLLTASNSGRVVEVNPAGKTVWEWTNRSYGDGSVPEVFDAKRYPLSRSEVASWPCSTVDAAGRSADESRAGSAR